MRRSISLLHPSAKNIIPLRGETFLFCTFLLRTFCRDAAKHFYIIGIRSPFRGFRGKGDAAKPPYANQIFADTPTQAQPTPIFIFFNKKGQTKRKRGRKMPQRTQRIQVISGLYFTAPSASSDHQRFVFSTFALKLSTLAINSAIVCRKD
jgi:hypothetical protein